MPPETIKRIALIGPESSGKTTLAGQLAEHYKTIWVPEYAREYMEKLNRAYTADDILIIAKEQLRIEEELISKANKLLFIDTEFIIAKIWCEDIFGSCPEWILNNIEEKKYDLYLLTEPDLEWKHDPVRENPYRREYFFELYLKEIKSGNFNYEIISGTGDRLPNAINAVEKFLNKKE